MHEMQKVAARVRKSFKFLVQSASISLNEHSCNVVFVAETSKCERKAQCNISTFERPGSKDVIFISFLVK